MPDSASGDARKAAEDIHKALRTGEFDRAQWFAQDALTRFPDDPHCSSQAGRLLATLRRDLDRARGLCQLAVEAEPANPEFLVNLAWVDLMAGDLGAARANLAQALHCDRDNMDALRLLQRVEQAEPKGGGRRAARDGEAGGQGLLERVKEALVTRGRQPV